MGDFYLTLNQWNPNLMNCFRNSCRIFLGRWKQPKPRRDLGLGLRWCNCEFSSLTRTFNFVVTLPFISGFLSRLVTAHKISSCLARSLEAFGYLIFCYLMVFLKFKNLQVLYKCVKCVMGERDGAILALPSDDSTPSK